MSPLLNASFPATISRLDNGLTVIHQQIPTTQVVVVDVWLRAGTTREPANWAGMAHFLEHMIFKGTATLPPGVFDQEIENRGGMTNAATSHDYAHYFLIAAAPYLEDTLPHLADLLLNAAIPEAEFDRERDVVLAEIRQAYDDPDWIGFQALSESVYQQHPYGRSVLGTEPDLLQHSPETMRQFHRAYYQPENMTVVVVGGIAQQPALEIVNRTFQQFATRCDRLQLPAEPTPPLIAGIRRQEIYLPRLEQARLLIAWPGPGIENFRSAYGLDLLSVLLGSGWSSRLVRDLREDQQLVQAICCNFSLLQDASLFTVSAWLQPEHLERVEALICTHLEELQTTPIPTAELARCQRLLCNDYAFSTETPDQIAGLYGYYNTIAKAELAVVYPQQIQSLQVDNLQALAQQYLSPYAYAATVLKPC